LQFAKQPSAVWLLSRLVTDASATRSRLLKWRRHVAVELALFALDLGRLRDAGVSSRVSNSRCSTT
jgi:hypothetical protein